MLNSDKPLLSAAWLGTSIGSVDLGLAKAADLGLFLSDTITQLPSADYLGSGAAELLVIGYVIAGIVSLVADLNLEEEIEV
jgi:hypothetical protein